MCPVVITADPLKIVQSETFYIMSLQIVVKETQPNADPERFLDSVTDSMHGEE